MGFNYDPFIRRDKLPHIWCPGCGLGTVMKALIRAVAKTGWDPNDVAVVSGIGCTARMTGYLDFNTLHTTHGRALTFATGIKLARPAKHVIVVSGDGDAVAIGGNHFIHACRRNIDITLIVVNNMIYGMTGGQVAPTTPIGAKASTTPYGNVDKPFDIPLLATASGASYVARGIVVEPLKLDKLITTGLQNEGMSVVEVMTNCHTQFGRRNKMKDPLTLREWLKDSCVTKKKADKMSCEELDGKFVTGILHHDTKPEYTAMYCKMRDEMAKASRIG